MLQTRNSPGDEGAGGGLAERFRVSVETLFDCYGAFTAIRDPAGAIVDFRIDYLNEAACTNNGRSLQEQLGHGLLELLPAHRETGLFEAYCAVVETGVALRREMEAYQDHYPAGRQSRWFDIQAAKCGDGFVAAWRDVTERRREIERLRWHESVFRCLLDANIMGIGVGNSAGEVRFVNDEMLRMMGRTRAEFDAGRIDWAHALTPDSLVDARARLGELQSYGGTTGYEREFQRPDGGRTPFIGAAALMPDGDTHVSVALDISARRDAERALAESERRLRLAVRASGTGIWEWDLATEKVTWTDETYAILGLSRSACEPTGNDFWQLVHPEDRERVWRTVHDAVAQRTHYAAEFRIVRSNGEVRWVENSGQASYDADGRPCRVLGTINDVTVRREVEQALRWNEERLRLAKTAAQLGIYDYDINSGRIECDGRLRDLWGIGPEDQVTYEMLLSGLHPDDREATQAAVDKALEPNGNGAYSATYRVISRADRRQRWVEATGQAAFENGRAVRLVGSVVDVSERKRAEKVLKDSEQHFKEMADAAPAMLWITDTDGRCSFLSRGWYQFTGQRKPQALGFGWLEAVHPDHRDESARIFLDANARREPFTLDYRLRRADGEYRWAIDSARPRFGEGGEFLGFIGSVIDIHERVVAEQALRESEARFRTLAESMSQFAWMADETGWVYWYNRRWYEYTGTTFEDMQGWGWTKVHHPDHVDRVVERLRHSWNTGEPWEDTFPLRSKEGGYRWFLSRAMPIRDESGTIVRWLGTNTDITEQRAAEQALRLADRQKDEFLATLAHELRNPLAPVRHAAAVGLMPSATPAQVQRSLQVIDRQSAQMALLLDDLLDVSRVTRGRLKLNRTEIKIGDVVKAAVEATAPIFQSRRHRLELALPKVPVVLNGDPLRLTQVISNLLTNAAKYTEAEGRICLSVRTDGDEVEISVEDNGIGIAPDQLERMFEMFVQGSAPPGLSEGGLGVGLALTRGLVVLHGGSIEARSRGEGQGSQFVVRLPLPPDQTARASQVPSTQDSVAMTSGRRILVVDDNEDAATTAAMLLRLWGHWVETAHDGEAALTTAADFRPDVVLLDLGMPNTDGFEVARRLRATEEGSEVLLIAMTGWGQDEDRRRTKAAGFDDHLTKPVSPEALATRIARPQET